MWEKILKLVWENRTWLFSGGGIVALGMLGAIFRPRFIKRWLRRGKEIISRAKSIKTVADSSTKYEIINDGLAFFRNTVRDVASAGGDVFTTAIFENYRAGDKVRAFIEKDLHVAGTNPCELVFVRLVLLDDPSKEHDWMRTFLKLKQTVTPDTHGFVLKPVVLHVRGRARPLIRYLSSSVPRASITLAHRCATEDDGERYLTYLGLWSGTVSSSFGLLWSSKVVYERTQSFLNPFVQRAHRYEDPSQVPDIGGTPEMSLVRRVQDCILEFAELREDILHVGLFGSSGLLAAGKIETADIIPHEADIDFVIVVRSDASVERPFRKDVEKAVLDERFPDDPRLEIEWSNIDGKYYEQRKSTHIDIQLHCKGDRYYSTKAPLLAYSIFGAAYIPIYSAEKEPVHQLLSLPQKILNGKERINLVLNSKEYGLRTAIGRICEYLTYPSTDPSRVAWIQTANAVWALSGQRPYTRNQAVEYLEGACASLAGSHDLVKKLKEFLNSTMEDRSEAKSRRLECRRILRGMEEVLVEKLS